MLDSKAPRKQKKQKFISAILAASSAIGLLAFKTPVRASTLEFSQKFLAPDGASDDNFGYSVALNGNYALIGSEQDDDNGSDSGSAYLFDLTSGDLLHKFLAPERTNRGLFGNSVALDGDTALIGSHWEDDVRGSAYLFDVNSGDLLHKLLAPDGTSVDKFGSSVALDENYALIGSQWDDDNGFSSGSAYLFDITSGDFLHKFTAPDAAGNDLFGANVALNGNYALISSYGDDDNGSNSGSAYLFDITSGDFLRKFTAPDAAPDDRFSVSIALNEDTALIGSSLDDDNGSNSGSAYLFDLTSGELLQKIIAPDGNDRDNFGRDVALSDNYALISSDRDDDNGSNSGSAYLFDLTSGELLQKFIAPDGASSDIFGWSVALDGDLALIGAHLDDDNGNNSGSVYLFAREEIPEKVPESSALGGLIAIGLLGTLKSLRGKK